MVFKVELRDDKMKQKVMRTVSKVSGLAFLTSSNYILTRLFSSFWVGDSCNNNVIYVGSKNERKSVSHK